MKKGQIYEGTIESVDFPNKGNIYLDGEKQHVVVKNGIPGQKVRFAVRKCKRGSAQGSLLEVLEDDYIRTARAKGLAPLSVILRHGLKNSLLPVITMMAIQISSLLSGAVITETLFSIPGVGRLAVDAINSRDMPLLQGTVIFTTVVIIGGNLAADLLYSVVDPRIRVEGGK